MNCAGDTNIIILPDNDQAGHDHADDIGRSLINITRRAVC